MATWPPAAIQRHHGASVGGSGGGGRDNTTPSPLKPRPPLLRKPRVGNTLPTRAARRPPVPLQWSTSWSCPGPLVGWHARASYWRIHSYSHISLKVQPFRVHPLCSDVRCSFIERFKAYMHPHHGSLQWMSPGTLVGALELLGEYTQISKSTAFQGSPPLLRCQMLLRRDSEPTCTPAMAAVDVLVRWLARFSFTHG